MGAMGALVLCLSYVAGLLLTGVSLRWLGVPVGGIGLLVLGVGLAIALPRLWRKGPRAQVWVAAGVVGLLATFYFQIRMPAAGQDDVSQLLLQPAGSFAGQGIEVVGFVETPPRLTRSQKIQFELEGFQARWLVGKQVEPQTVSGTVYVTVPLLQGTGIYPGQMVAVRGQLYAPQPATNPGGFDFRAYLAREGIFAGLNGKQVDFPAEEGRFQEQQTWGRSLSGSIQRGLWQIRQRIVRSQVIGLGVPEGPLVSAMLLGKSGVDVPYDVRDAFANVGLAHALAASGFQVSLLIGIMLSLTKNLPTRMGFAVCTGVLLLYLGLTGLEPSVARAGLMGFSVLVAITLGQKVKPMGSLLLAATLLLLLNPIWIWDLGFQLSFLATLGLLVTAPVLTQWLDWLPPAIAPLIAVPVAAYIWTLPIQLHAFGVVSPYSIPINVVTAPVITFISLGSGVSALVGLVLPALGSALSWLLYYPSHWLIGLTQLAGQMPGNAWATGTILASQVLVLYCLYLVLWQQAQLHRYWWVVGAMCLGLVAIPAWSATAARFQVTVLATTGEPLLVVQHKGETGLIGGSSEQDANFAILPFLKKQGINQVNWAIAPTLNSDQSGGWHYLLDHLPIRTLYSSQKPQPNNPALQPLLDDLRSQQGQSLTMELNQVAQPGSIGIRWVNADPLALRFQIGDQIWLMLGDPQSIQQQQALIPKLATMTSVLWWSGEELDTALLERIQPKVAIASTRSVPPSTAAWFRQRQIPLYATGQDGGIQWTPQTGFRAILKAEDV